MLDHGDRVGELRRERRVVRAQEGGIHQQAAPDDRSRHGAGTRDQEAALGQDAGARVGKHDLAEAVGVRGRRGHRRSVERRQRGIDERRLRRQQVGDLAVPQRVLQEQIGLVLHRVAQAVVPGREDVGVDDHRLDVGDGEVAEHRRVQVGARRGRHQDAIDLRADLVGVRQRVARRRRQQCRVGRAVGEEVGQLARELVRRQRPGRRRRRTELGAVEELRRLQHAVDAELRGLLRREADLARVFQVGVELVEGRRLVASQRAAPRRRPQGAQPGLRAGVERGPGLGALGDRREIVEHVLRRRLRDLVARVPGCVGDHRPFTRARQRREPPVLGIR